MYSPQILDTGKQSYQVGRMTAPIFPPTMTTSSCIWVDAHLEAERLVNIGLEGKWRGFASISAR
jgi:hypothetical protein